MSPNNADRMANSVDTDQTAPLGGAWSGSALFAQAYLSENLGSLRYIALWQVKVTMVMNHSSMITTCIFVGMKSLIQLRI